MTINSVTPAGSIRCTRKEFALISWPNESGRYILSAYEISPPTHNPSDATRIIRRVTTPSIEAGIASGKVVMTKHLDYLDYSAVRDQLRNVQAVDWALGTSSRNVDNETYSVIHVDFPVQFVKE